MNNNESENEKEAPDTPAVSEIAVPDKPKKWLAVFDAKFNMPWTVAGTIISVVSIIATLLVTLLFQQRTEISSKTSDSLKVHDSQSVSPKIKVLDENGQVIIDDIYIAEISIWNSGNTSIDDAAMLLPMRILLFPVQRIINITTTVEIEPKVAMYDISEVAIDKDEDLHLFGGVIIPNTFDRNEYVHSYTKAIQVKWKHLEPNFGVKLQVLYVAETRDRNAFRTTVEGFITNRGSLVQRTSPSDSSVLILGLSLLTVIMMLVTLLAVPRTSVDKSLSRKSHALLWLAGVTFIIYLVLTIKTTWELFAANPSPPF